MPRLTLSNPMRNRYRKKPPTKSFGLDSVVSYRDAFRRKRNPSSAELVREYKRFIFTCANFNANSASCIPLRLYLRTNLNDEPTILRKGYDLSPVSHQKKEYLSSLSYLNKALRSFVDIEEVVNHPILDLLHKVNDTPYLNGNRLRVFNILYEEVVGKSYWFIETNVFGVPENIWLLPAQYIRPVKEFTNNNKIVDYYEYTGSISDADPPKYRPEDIIPFLRPSLTAPYRDGVGFVQASFDDLEVNNKLITHEDAYLENEGRPDAILSPKTEESAFGPEEAERYEYQYRSRFARGRGGGLWVIPEDITIHPLSFPPRDLARLEINKWTRLDIANAACIPIALLDGGGDTESAERQHAKYCLRPKLEAEAAVLNDQLISRFDPTGRLFFAYDDPVPEDAAAKVQKIVQFVMNGIWTKNEGRVYDGTFGMHDDPEADELRAINVSPELSRQNKRDSGDDDSTKPKEQRDASGSNGGEGQN